MRLLSNVLLASCFIFANLTALTQNPTDACGTGVQILVSNSSCTTINYTLAGSYSNGGDVNASCVAGNDRDDGWYRFQATGTTTSIDVSGDLARTIAVYTGSCGTGELAGGCDTQAAGTNTTVSVTTTIGTWYYLQIHRRSGNNAATMTGTVCIYAGAASGSGADCSNTTLLTPGTQQCGTNSNVGSFPDGGGTPTNPCNTSYNDGEYWYSYVGTGNALQLDVSGLTATYSGLFVLDACPSGSPTCISSHTSGSSTANFSVTTPALTLGQTYYIVMSNWGAPYQTDYCLDATSVVPPATPANDDCGGAISLTVNPDNLCGTVTSSTVAAATASSQDATACFGTEDDDVWFSFVATSTTHLIDLQNIVGGPSTDMYHSVWSGTCPSLSLVTGSCSDPNSSTVSGLTVGVTYYVRVFTYTSTTGQTGTFDICIGTPPPPPANDECSGAIALTVNPDFACGTVTSSSVASATASAQDATACFGTEDDDIWFTFVATGTTHSIEIQNIVGSPSSDMYHSLWTGTCHH